MWKWKLEHEVEALGQEDKSPSCNALGETLTCINLFAPNLNTAVQYLGPKKYL